MNLHPFINVFHPLVNLKGNHHFHYLTWFAFIWVVLLVRIMRYISLHIIIMTTKDTCWKYAQAFFIHFRQVTNSPIKLIIYVIFTECLQLIITYVVSFKIIAVFKRDAITKVTFFAHVQTKHCISYQFIIDDLLNNTHSECFYS